MPIKELVWVLFMKKQVLGKLMTRVNYLLTVEK